MSYPRASREDSAAAPVFPSRPDAVPTMQAAPRRVASVDGLPELSNPRASDGGTNPSRAPIGARRPAGAVAPAGWRGGRGEERIAAAPRQMREQARETPMSGTIVIDGAELGRWIVDHLTQAASRPPAGGTAFDPRMTPVWAGPSIGA